MWSLLYHIGKKTAEKGFPKRVVEKKTSLGEHCTPHNFVLLVTFGGTPVRLIMYLTMHQK